MNVIRQLPSNYELMGRHQKAFRLANRLRENAITSQEARQIRPEEWRLLAEAIGVNPASEETIALVIAKLEEWENDPLPTA